MTRPRYLIHVEGLGTGRVPFDERHVAEQAAAFLRRGSLDARVVPEGDRHTLHYVVEVEGRRSSAVFATAARASLVQVEYLARGIDAQVVAIFEEAEHARL